MCVKIVLVSKSYYENTLVAKILIPKFNHGWTFREDKWFYAAPELKSASRPLGKDLELIPQVRKEINKILIYLPQTRIIFPFFKDFTRLIKYFRSFL